MSKTNQNKYTRLKRGIIELLLVSLGVLSAAFGLKSLLLPNNFIDGGATGISLLIAETTRFDIAYLILVINIPFIIIGYFQMSRRFVLKTILAVIALSLILALLEFPTVTDDLLLASAFGGFFLGAGIGLSIRGGCVIDGTEILALYISRKLNASMGDVIMVINIFIFGAAAWLLGMEVAMYSILTYFVASKTMDFIIQGVEEYLGITIISHHSGEIKEALVNKMNSGVTILKGQGGYGKKGEIHASTDVLYTVISRLELLKINRILNDIDPDAFVVIQGVRDVKGGILKRRPSPK